MNTKSIKKNTEMQNLRDGTAETLMDLKVICTQ